MHPVSAACSLYLFQYIAFPLRHRHLCSVIYIFFNPWNFGSKCQKTSVFFNDKSRTRCTYQLKTMTPVGLHWLWEVVLKSGYLRDEINPKKMSISAGFSTETDRERWSEGRFSRSWVVLLPQIHAKGKYMWKRICGFVCRHVMGHKRIHGQARLWISG